MKTLQNEIKLATASTDKVLYSKHVQHKLDEIRQEAEEAYALDNEIDPVTDSAYDDAYSVLEILFNNNVPMPDIGWLVDGGIGFEWRSQHVKGIGTISIYGGNKIVYGASLGSQRRVKGICVFDDSILLVHFFPILKGLCFQ